MSERSVKGRSAAALDVLILRSTKERIPRAFLNRWVDAIVKSLLHGREKGSSLHLTARKQLARAGEISLVFVTSREMRRLNREFRVKDKVTDVLSFAPSEEGSLGELVFSLDVIERQARQHGLTKHQELGYMVLHGVLHLLGYDHETSEKDAQAMFGVQDRVFDAVLSRW